MHIDVLSQITQGQSRCYYSIISYVTRSICKPQIILGNQISDQSGAFQFLTNESMARFSISMRRLKSLFLIGVIK